MSFPASSCHCEFHTGRPADPPWMKPAFTVMAGLVPAIRGGRVPRPIGRDKPGHDGASDAELGPGFSLGPETNRLRRLTVTLFPLLSSPRKR